MNREVFQGVCAHLRGHQSGNDDQRVPFLVPTLQLQASCSRASMSNKPLYVAPAGEFCGVPADADSIDARSGGLRRLEDCLRPGFREFLIVIALPFVCLPFGLDRGL